MCGVFTKNAFFCLMQTLDISSNYYVVYIILHGKKTRLVIQPNLISLNCLVFYSCRLSKLDAKVQK